MTEVMAMGRPLTLDVEAIRALCERFGVSRLAVFGSATTDHFDPERSDVDFLVEFHHGRATLSNYFGLREALEALLLYPVDLVSPAALRNPYLAESVEASRAELYAA